MSEREVLTKEVHPIGCSALLKVGGCKHGHAVTLACTGNPYPKKELIQPCVREDWPFDEATKTVQRPKIRYDRR